MLLAQLQALGVRRGDVLLVHTALSKVRSTAQELIEMLLTAVGPAGTLVMPSMADVTMCRFAAHGPLAARITAPHPVDVPHGLDSPPGRVYELNGSVLLLGVGHDSNTTIHVAENVAGVRYRQPKYATVLEDGRPKRYEYGETDHCCERFASLDTWLGEKQKLGRIGGAQARLAQSRDIVEAALSRLREEETVFLHAAATCAECDSARAAML